MSTRSGWAEIRTNRTADGRLSANPEKTRRHPATAPGAWAHWRLFVMLVHHPFRLRALRLARLLGRPGFHLFLTALLMALGFAVAHA